VLIGVHPWLKKMSVGTLVVLRGYGSNNQEHLLSLRLGALAWDSRHACSFVSIRGRVIGRWSFVVHVPAFLRAATQR